MEGYLGQVIGFAGNFAPRNWAFCEGQLQSIAQNSALFSILGTIYGGDGRTTFALPDLRGRSMIGPGRGPGLQDYREGVRGGSEFVTLNTTQMPSHNHGIELHAEDTDGNRAGPAGRMLAKDSTGASIYADPVTGNTNKVMASQSLVMGNTGGNQPFDNRSPYLPIYYVICLQGIFPSRS